MPAFQFVRSIPKHEVVPSYVRFVTTDCRTLPATNYEARNGSVRCSASIHVRAGVSGLVSEPHYRIKPETDFETRRTVTKLRLEASK